MSFRGLSAVFVIVIKINREIRSHNRVAGQAGIIRSDNMSDISQDHQHQSHFCLTATFSSRCFFFLLSSLGSAFFTFHFFSYRCLFKLFSQEVPFQNLKKSAFFHIFSEGLFLKFCYGVTLSIFFIYQIQND